MTKLTITTILNYHKQLRLYSVDFIFLKYTKIFLIFGAVRTIIPFPNCKFALLLVLILN